MKLVLLILLSILITSASLRCTNNEPFLPSGNSNICCNKVPSDQVDTLINFYNSLNGPNWFIQGKWLNMSVSPCDWGIYCNSDCNKIYHYSK